MYRMIVFVCLFFCINEVRSQWTFNAPDYDLIKTQICDTSSNYYYPRLMERLVNGDMSLTTEDFRYLYYGYIFQDKYEPYWRSPYEDKLGALYSKPDLDESDCDELIKLATLSIAEFPFDLRQMNSLAYAYHLKGDEVNSQIISFKFQGILQAIMSSGNGMNCETGFHVISTGHEYIILSMLEFRVLGQSLTSDFCDCMKVADDQNREVNIYFNIKRIWDTNIEIMKNNRLQSVRPPIL